MKRSIGVSVIAVLAMVSGVLQLLRGIGLLVRGGTQGPLAMAVGVTVAVTFGAVTIAAAMGCWQLRSWGRRLMIVLSVLSCIIGVLLTAVMVLGLGRGLLAGARMAGAVLIVFLVVFWMIYPGFVIWFFRRPSVKAQFSASAAG